MIKNTWTIGIILSLMILSTPAFGADNASINVSARVLPHLSQSLVQQQATLNVTKADIAKGYVDVPAGTVLQVNTNVRRNGYFLHVAMQDLVQEVMVTINGRAVEVPFGGGLVHHVTNTRQETLQIGYRIFITDGTTPGTYSWPVSISASLI